MEIKKVLSQQGYVLDEKNDVWHKNNYYSISYNDGDEVEERIAKIIGQARDISVLSTELKSQITDWPSLYHLSPSRGNILRPFSEKIDNASVLEIGAGCGAITRFLAENNANVLALEGSRRRANIARSRTRDLNNVTVLSENFENFSCDAKFDVVTLIGVLEYSNLFVSADQSAEAMLKKAKALLKPEGQLIIAIENQLGLKYFAGAPEDHLGVSMYGLEGRYQKDQPQTYGRVVLSKMLERAGFGTSEFLAPFPDYKLPVSIISESGCLREDFDAAALAWQSVKRDPQLPSKLTFSMELSWPSIFENKLSIDLANSFLVVASNGINYHLDDAILAYHYSTERLSDYCKETVFRDDKDKGQITVEYKRLSDGGALSSYNNSIINFVCPESDVYKHGRPLTYEFIRLVSKDDWSIEDTQHFLKKYLGVLGDIAIEQNFSIDLSSPYSLLPGKFFDVVCNNLILHQDGKVSLIDKEWELVSSIELGHLLFRTLLQLIGSVSNFGRTPLEGMTRGQFVNKVFESLQLPLAPTDYERYLKIEEIVTKQVTGINAHQAVKWWPENPIRNPSIDELFAEREARIASLNQSVTELKQGLIDRDAQLVEIFNSKSWRLTKPLRHTVRIMTNLKLISMRYRASMMFLRIWRSIPLPIKAKQRLKNYLFSVAPFIFRNTSAYRNWQGLQHFASDDVQGQYDLLNEQSIKQYVPLLKAPPLKNKPAKLICLYLPQFHPIPENDEWWGEGFTEWTNVKPAQPQFQGHYQPHIPGELGYYNLLETETQKRQIELAKTYGIEGFCFYFYWFAGKTLLEQPITNYLENKELDLPFCLCWANENWSRRWDGLDSEILIAQNYSTTDDLEFIEHVARYMKDDRYIRVDNKPLLVVYRPNLLPEPKKTVQIWRKWCRENGIGEIYLTYTQSFEIVDPAIYGFDAAIEFPPNNMSPPLITKDIPGRDKSFEGQIYDWRVFPNRSNSYQRPDYKLFRGVNPSWDNTARRKSNATILYGSSPLGYQKWLCNAIQDTQERFANPDERLIFVNAWNEWAEGAHLEPDQKYGYAYLEASRMALKKTEFRLETKNTIKVNNQNLAIIIHVYYLDVFEEILGFIEKLETEFKLYITTTNEQEAQINELLQNSGYDYMLLALNNHGRDVLPFFKVLPHVKQAGHQILLKLHTKKSVHRHDGHKWRSEIFEKLMRAENVINLISRFKSDEYVGFVGPAGHIVPMSLYWGQNQYKVIHLAQRLGLSQNEAMSLKFIAGTMFYAKINALEPLMQLAIDETDFESENGQIDGTFAHALERVLPMSGYVSDHKILSTDGYTIFEERKVKNTDKMTKSYQYA